MKVTLAFLKREMISSSVSSSKPEVICRKRGYQDVVPRLATGKWFQLTTTSELSLHRFAYEGIHLQCARHKEA